MTSSFKGCQPEALFTAPTKRVVKEDMEPIKRTLIDEARKAKILFLWLDCDFGD